MFVAGRDEGMSKDEEKRVSELIIEANKLGVMEGKAEVLGQVCGKCYERIKSQVVTKE